MSIMFLKDARRNGAPAAVPPPQNAEPAKPAPRIKLASHIDPDTGEDIFNPPPRRLPEWEDPFFVEPLLLVLDERERLLVRQIIHLMYEMRGYFDRARASRSATGATREFDAAAKLCRQVIELVKSLVEHRRGGVQSIVKVSGTMVGREARIQAARLPRAGSPEAHLVERVTTMEDQLSEMVDRFVESTCNERRAIDDWWLSLNGQMFGHPAASWEEFERWSALSDSAIKLMNAVSVCLNKLERGGRQVVVTENEPMKRSNRPMETEMRRASQASDGAHRRSPKRTQGLS